MSYTFSQTLPMQSRAQDFMMQALQVIGGSLLIALCTQIKIFLPWSVIPLTLQSFMVLLLGGLFGSRKGAWMVFTYMAYIVMGLPMAVSSPLGLLGPSGGYIFGFALQAYLMGWFVERSNTENRCRTALWAAIGTSLVQLTLGTCWLAHFVGWKSAWMMGFFPFVTGELLKSIVVAGLIKRYRQAS